MKNLKLSVVAGVASVVIAASVASPALAWHPKGKIVKYVQNVTQNSSLEDANSENDAVAAKPGDTLKYIVTISNVGTPDQRGWNDMAKTVLKDTLPAGVELVSDASKHQITEDLGTIKPGKSVSREYLVKVTSDTDGDVITNEACFTGNSTANDNPQNGCDDAVVKVNVPEVPEEPETPVTPVTPETPEAPAPEAPETLPNAGAGNVILMAAVVSALGYAGYLAFLKRRAV
jgi:uncharacterized repeat protein (TIGR01451 family)